MRIHLLSTVAVTILMASLFHQGAYAQDEDPGTALTLALENLQRLIRRIPNEGGWPKYLMLKELAAERAKGNGADKTVVKQVLERFEGSAPGLELPQFVAVREALRDW